MYGSADGLFAEELDAVSGVWNSAIEVILIEAALRKDLKPVIKSMSEHWPAVQGDLWSQRLMSPWSSVARRE